MVNYFDRFIPNYASIFNVLNNLIKKEVKFVWTEDCQKAFETLKQCKTNPPVLYLEKFEERFILMTDASEYGKCGYLLQEIEGIRVPNSYHSKKLSSSELRSTT